MLDRFHSLGIAILSMTLLGSFPVAQAQVKEGAESVVLMGGGLNEIHVNGEVATTVRFPKEINLVTGFGLIQEMDEVANFSASTEISLVHFQHVSEDSIVLRLLNLGKPTFATVRCEDDFYLLKIVPDEQAHLAVTISEEITMPMEVNKEQVVEERIDYSPESLIGILQRARQRAFLEKSAPGLYAGWEQRNGVNLESDFGDLHATIYEIHRWAEKDAIVLRCWIENSTDKTLAFEPNDVGVRIADRVYPVQLVDTSGRVQANGRAALDVVLEGDASGGREHLSIRNDFRIELPNWKEHNS